MSYNQEWYKKRLLLAKFAFFFRAFFTLQLMNKFLEMQLEVYGNTS